MAKWIQYFGPEPKVSFSAETGESLPGCYPPFLMRLQPVQVPDEVAEVRCWNKVVEYGPGNRPKVVRQASGEWRECEAPAVENIAAVYTVPDPAPAPVEEV